MTFAPQELSQDRGSNFETLRQTRIQRLNCRDLDKENARQTGGQDYGDTAAGRTKAQGRHPPPPWAQAHPHALLWVHSHEPVLEEDVSLAHSFRSVAAGLDISDHTVPRDGFLLSWAAGRHVVDARGGDCSAEPVKAGEVGTHREGAETLGDPAVPGPSLDLAQATCRAAGRLARQAGA